MRGEGARDGEDDMPIKLTHLRDVVAAAELGSLRAASRHLGIAQPAISRSIREIENELGATLFQRHQQGIRLTAVGEAFLRRALMVQSELRRAREEVEQMKGELGGHVTVGMSTVSTFTMMPSAIRAFRQKYPRAIVKVTEGFFQDMEGAMMNGQVDFYVGPFNPTRRNTGLITEGLFEHNRAVIGRKGHPLSGAERLEDLVEAEWVKQTMSERETEADFELPFTRRGLPEPRIVMYTTSATATLLAVANSDLLTIVPASMLGRPIAAEEYEVFHMEDSLNAPPICLVRRADLPLTPLAEYLSDMVRRVGVQVAHAGKATSVRR